MIRFSCDYCEGAHPSILEALGRTNFEQTEGYEEDEYCDNARKLIQEAIGCKSCDIHFLSGGTQTNMIFIAHALRPWQAVIAAKTGHIATHETGAIESTGHKIITMPTSNGKLTTELITQALREHTDHHMVEPKMVYISDSTEIGTIYTKSELEQIHTLCQEKGLYLYMDGARLSSALTAEGNDLTLKDFSLLCDAFYIGGTKCGALFGEALVIVNPELSPNFNFTIKQHGGLFAKGRILGIQFETLFKKDLYLELGTYTNYLCSKLRDAFAEKGIKFLIDSPTNQIFPILPNTLIAALRNNYSFRDWEIVDSQHTAVRFVTSWAMTNAMVDQFISDFKRLCYE